MNKLIENKLRSLIQKEIKRTLSERTVQIEKDELSKLRGPIQKLIAQYTSATKGGQLNVDEIDDAIEDITYWRLHSNKKINVKEDAKSRKKSAFNSIVNKAKSILNELDKWMQKQNISDEYEETQEAISWLQLNYPNLDSNIKNYIIQNNKYNISEDDY